MYWVAEPGWTVPGRHAVPAGGKVCPGISSDCRIRGLSRGRGHQGLSPRPQVLCQWQCTQLLLGAFLSREAGPLPTLWLAHNSCHLANIPPPPGLGCASSQKRAQVPMRPGCPLAGWLIGPHLDLISHGFSTDGPRCLYRPQCRSGQEKNGC